MSYERCFCFFLQQTKCAINDEIRIADYLQAFGER